MYITNPRIHSLKPCRQALLSDDDVESVAEELVAGLRDFQGYCKGLGSLGFSCLGFRVEGYCSY